MRLAAFQQVDGEGHGFLDKTLITGEHVRPAPHQAKPGFGSHRRRFEIAPLDPGRGPMKGPGPMPASPGREQRRGLHPGQEHGGGARQAENERADQSAEQDVLMTEATQRGQQQPE